MFLIVSQICQWKLWNIIVLKVNVNHIFMISITWLSKKFRFDGLTRVATDFISVFHPWLAHVFGWFYVMHMKMRTDKAILILKHNIGAPVSDRDGDLNRIWILYTEHVVILLLQANIAWIIWFLVQTRFRYSNWLWICYYVFDSIWGIKSYLFIAVEWVWKKKTHALYFHFIPSFSSYHENWSNLFQILIC